MSSGKRQLATVTHARLRAAQGDLRGARSVLRSMLRRNPDDRAARELLERLAGRADIGGAEALETAPPPPLAADAASLAARFRAALATPGRPPDLRRRIRRLESWLERICRD